MSLKIKRLVIVILSALMLLSVLAGCKNAIAYSQDFQYDAAKTLAMGINPYDESLNPTGILDSFGMEEYYKQMEANQFPSLLFLLFPYVCLSPLMARYAWLLSNLIFTVAIIFLLKKTFFEKFDELDFAIVALLMVSGTPWRNQIGVGQHTLFSLMFFLIAVYFADKKPVNKEWLNVLISALALSVSYFKYTLTVPIGLYFIYKRKWKELFISVIPHLLLTEVAAIILKDSFINMLLKPLKVANALTSEGSMDIGSMLGGGYFTMVLTVALIGLLLALVMFVPQGNDNLIISMLTVWSLIITYHRVYDHFVLIIPLCVLTGFGISKDLKKDIDLYFIVLLIGFDFYIMRIFDSSGGVILPVIFLYYVYAAYITAKTVMKCQRQM